MKRTSTEILSVLRAALTTYALDALLIPSSDDHNSEYVAPPLQRRAFVSNFRGSAGSVLITSKEALLWTDGRYWLEAAESMYEEYTLMKQGAEGVPSIEKWVKQHLGNHAVVGVNPFVLTSSMWDRMSKHMKLKAIQDVVKPMMVNDGGIEWNDSLNPDSHKIYIRPVCYAGKTCKEKRQELVTALEKHSCDLLVLSALDEVAWVSNLRGADVPCNPVFCSYAIVTVKNPKVEVYVDMKKVPEKVKQEMSEEIDFFPYDTFSASLQQAIKDVVKDRESVPEKSPLSPHTCQVLVDTYQTSKAVQDLITEAGGEVVSVVCGPAQKLKALKTPVELKGFRDCHVRDGAALTQYLAWLHEEITVRHNTSLNEYEAAEKLEAYRAANDLFVQLSFPSISSSGPNGAIVHYEPTAKKNSLILPDQLYLIDSGAHYWDGTTDTTRTICFTSTPKKEEKESYTLVLKGHIALNKIVFPKGTSGHRLDSAARQALWSVGLDYAHGTGHGVGSFLVVHEGPHGIGKLPVGTNAVLEASMVTSNEPGYYKDGAYGIRIENVEEIVVKPLKYSADGFLGFSSLTVVPLCPELIDLSLLTEEERAWVNRYHQRVLETLLPELEKRNDVRAVSYLKHCTQPL